LASAAQSYEAITINFYRKLAERSEALMPSVAQV
jgi:hypothetical protein